MISLPSIHPPYKCTDRYRNTESCIKGRWVMEQVIRGPKRVQWARVSSVESSPRLAFATPMEEAHGARMKVPTKPVKVVAAEPMLVPAVVHWGYVPCKYQQERGE
uniref:Uncharacterized protein n=1 Tax=Opuntia streptacantha TaxID=393608 RepID=A0A7C9CMZ4_OPUST